MGGFQEKANFIWSVADLLRGDYKQSEYGRVILPLTVLRRLDQVLEPTKEKVLAAGEKHKGSAGLDRILRNASGRDFYNTSPYTLERLIQDPNNIALNLRNHISGYSENARKIIEEFRLEQHIDRLDDANLLFKVVQKFAELDLHPDRVSNREMGYIFEELIRRFSEISNETAGEHFTPRDVVRVMVGVLLSPDDQLLSKRGIVRTVYDPACGTGGMLTIAEEHVKELNPDAALILFGQELNPESYATCVSDLLITGHDPDRIKLGNTFSDDQLPRERFDYMLCNPPFGVEWKKVEDLVRAEHETKGYGGRFGAGLPRVNDGSLLFLQHMLAKMKPVDKGGSRIGIVFNGSPLFTGGPGSGESEIRRWIIENDWLECVIALPDDMFYNTGISTYLWFLTNRKPAERKGKVQLINATGFCEKMRKSLGEKRNQISETQTGEIVRLYGEFEPGEHVKILPNRAFGYRRVTIERPLRMSFQTTSERVSQVADLLRTKKTTTTKGRPAKGGEAGWPDAGAILHVLREMPSSKRWTKRADFEKALTLLFEKADLKIPRALLRMLVSALGERDARAEPCLDDEGNVEADPSLRDTEVLPLDESLKDHMAREVVPFVPEAWPSDAVRDPKDGLPGVVGYEIKFSKYFYEYPSTRNIEEIDQEIHLVEKKILELLQEPEGR